MTVAVNVSVRGQRDLDGLPLVIHARVLAKLEDLKAYPQVAGVKALKGPWLGHYRVRVGNYRIVFVLSTGTMTVVAIDDRKDVY